MHGWARPFLPRGKGEPGEEGTAMGSAAGRVALAAATEQASPTAAATLLHTQEALTSNEVPILCVC